MDTFNTESVVAPTFDAAVISAAVNVPAAPAAKVECTRDTRGEAPCAVVDCENCN
jgi:hypothetical protein